MKEVRWGHSSTVAALMVSTWAHSPHMQIASTTFREPLTLSAPSGSEEEDNYRVKRIEVPFKNADYPRIKQASLDNSVGEIIILN